MKPNPRHAVFFIALVVLAAGQPAIGAEGTGAAAPGVLGVGVTNAVPPSQGALVGRVVPESAAARAGLLPQDLILEADSQPILSAADLTAYVTRHRAGDRITLTVSRWRGSSPEILQVTATLAAAATQIAPAPPRPAAAVAAPAEALTHVSWTTFTDPSETAFSIEVPQGWRVAGGVFRKIPLWGSAVVRTLSPDGRTLIALGDPDSVPYGAPVAASDYVRRFTERAMASACSGLKITSVTELPDVERFATSRTLSPYTQWSAAQATFTCSGDRQAGMSGQAVAVLEYMTTLRSGHAQILAAFVTSAGHENEADQLLNHVVSSLHENPEWVAREQQTAHRLDQAAMARWHGEQHQFQQMDDAITNTGHFVGADGQHYDLDARPRYQWRTPDGHTVGTDTPTPPSPGATQLERLPDR